MVTQAEADENPEEHLGRDIALDSTDDLKISASDDYQLITFEDNLRQAMLNRLRTAVGELKLNPNYGSKLHELLGTNPTDETLILARAHVRETLLQEPRIEEIISITAQFRDLSIKNEIDINVTVQPIKDLAELNMVFRLFFEGTLVEET